MRKLIDDPRLMIKVCDLYYIQSMSQVQIAKTLDISRPTISRLLAAAKEKGIVEINISNLDAIKYWELERDLEEKFQLDEVIVVDSASTEEKTQENLGVAGARYLEYIIKDDYIVGISMGSTLHQIVTNISKPAASDVTFVPLVGGLGQARIELHSNHLVELFARVYDGDFLSLHAPARVSNEAIRDELLKEESLSSVIQLAKKVDIALVGIGYPSEHSSIKATQYFKENEVEFLTNRRVVGELCMQFYDIKGNTEPYKKDNTVIGLNIQELKKVPCSIGVAGGIEKVSAIKGAVRAGYINVLITDAKCAAALLKSS